MHHLFQIKQQITRYHPLQQIQQVIGKESISIAKFYRILANLDVQELVGFEKGNSDLYNLTAKGVNALETSKTIIGQVGVQVTNFFSESMKNIIAFSKYSSGKVLFVDFPKLYDLIVLSITK